MHDHSITHSRSCAKHARVTHMKALPSHASGVDMSETLQDLDKARQELDEAMREEASSRTAADAALRDSAQQAESELSDKLSELEAKVKVELEDIILEAERANAGHLHRSQEEHADRQAAITEVYRRLQIARELDALLTQVAESAMREQFQVLQTEVERSGAMVESDVNDKLQGLSERVDELQQEDETLKLKIDDLESATRQSAQELRASDDQISNEVKMIASQMQDRLEESSSRFTAGIKSLGDLVDSTAQTLQSAVTAERDERVKADADLDAEVKQALSAQKEERDAALSNEREERTAAVVQEKEHREASLQALRQAHASCCVHACLCAQTSSQGCTHA